LATSAEAATTSERPDHAPFRIVFAGNMGKAQSLNSVLDAARLLQDTHGLAFEFLFIGGGVELDELKRRAADLHLDNVRFERPVPMSEIGATLASADALLVHLKDDPLFKITVPSKTQAYMAAGRPLLMAVGGDADELVTRSRGGVLAQPDNPQSIAAAAVQLLNATPDERRAMGKNAQTFYASELSQSRGVARFAAIFDAVVRNRHSA
jgi:glycosyltransferase involved in cell wall biosynthesis